VLGDAATKSDIERLREGFRSEIARLEERVGGLDKRVDMVFKFTLALNTPILSNNNRDTTEDGFDAVTCWVGRVVA